MSAFNAVLLGVVIGAGIQAVRVALLYLGTWPCPRPSTRRIQEVNEAAAAAYAKFAVAIRSDLQDPDDPPVRCWHTGPGYTCDWDVCRHPQGSGAVR